MPLTVSVVGGTGVYARHLIPRLVARGHTVRALVRRPEAAEFARACGAEVHVADVFEPESLRTAMAGSDVALNIATAVPGPSGRGDFASNERLRREGAPLWLQACADAGVPRVLQQSIAWVNAGGTDEWTDEDTLPAAPSAGVATALAMEESVRNSGLDWVILRGAHFYGPGTGADQRWFDQAAAGTLLLPGEGDAFTTLIHVADMAEATAAAVDRWPSRQALIIGDDAPARWSEVYAYVAALAGAKAPEPGGPSNFVSTRLRNTRAREALGWAPAYPDYRSGLAR